MARKRGSRCQIKSLIFIITKLPDFFKLNLGWMHILEDPNNDLDIELTVKPVGKGIELMGNDKHFSLPFRVRFMGSTSDYCDITDGFRKIQLIGRFKFPLNMIIWSFGTEEIRLELTRNQWEVILENPQINHNFPYQNFVSKIDNPLPIKN